VFCANKQSLFKGFLLIVQAFLSLMEPKSYDHHSSFEDSTGINILDDNEKANGLLAQDLFQIIPEVVRKPEDDTKELWAINYSKNVPVLVKAIQEKNELIENQKSEMNQLHSKIELLIQRIESLEVSKGIY